MRPYLLLLLLCLGFSTPLAGQQSDPSPALMPYPMQLDWLDEAPFQLASKLNWQYPPEHQQILEPALQRFLQRLQQQHPGVQHAATAPISLSIEIESAEPFWYPKLHQDESYRLRLDAAGILLQAPTHLGALHGLETLLQLLAGHSSLAALAIKDAPRFAWRGLLLDPARHFLPVDTIKRQLDGMAAAKLNVLHWHLTDDQGWRLESKRFPKLHQIGGTDGYYSQEDVRRIIDYAALRGIRVVPEIDVPGHTTALGAAYPELMSMPGPAKPEKHWGIHPAVLDPTQESSYQFLTKLLEEVASLFPDPYLHIGGDEVLPDHWQQNPGIRAFKQQHGLKDHLALQTWFNQRVLGILKQLDRRMIGWDEILTPELPSSSLVQSWRGLDSVVEAAQAGHDVILSTGYYLDQPQFAHFHYRIDPLPQPSPAQTEGYQAWSGWRFTIPRLRGAPIEGKLWLLHYEQRLEGFIDFAGRSRQALPDLTVEANRLRFSLDTWMGPVQADWTLAEQLAGELVVGNAPYAVAGEQIDWHNQQDPLPAGIARPALSLDEQARVLGGEIALWGELVNAEVIDRRLWPQALVVAERLWSTAELRDEAKLYQRLEQLEPWLEVSVGLLHLQQQTQGLASLVEPEGLAALQQLVVALEPAHYYHRLHERSVRQQYHNQAPLNRLVDFLPAEQSQLRALEQLLKKWQQQPDTDLKPLKAQLSRWQQLPHSLTPYLTDKPAAQELIPIIDTLSQLADVGLSLLKAHARQEAAPAGADALWQQSRGIEAELVIAAHRLIQPLLTPVSSQQWVEANTFTSGIEGPAFGPDGALYVVNYRQQGSIGRVSGQDTTELVFELPAGSIGNGIRFSADGSRMFIADYSRNRVWQYQMATQALSELVHVPAMHQPNDLALLPPDTLFASDPDWQSGSGQLWRVSADGRYQLLESGMGTTNGIEVSSDGHKLFVNESLQRRIWRYRIDEQQLHDKTLLAAFSHGGLDGMRMVQPGVLAVTRFGEGRVILLSTTGALLAELPLQHRYPTNLAVQWPYLYVTLQDCGCIERLSLDGILPDPADAVAPQ